MPLYSERGDEITRVTHEDFYNRHYPRLTAQQRQAIEDEINAVLDSGRIHTTSWVPGADWTGKPYQAIYDVACDEDWHRARYLYGLIFMNVVINREETWYCGRYPRSEDEIIGLTYWRPDD